jgi:hypothetical protein
VGTLFGYLFGGDGNVHDFETIEETVRNFMALK